MKIILIAILAINYSAAVTYKGKPTPWMQKLKQNGVSELNLCGDPDIANTERSLKKDFFMGPSKKAHAFSKLPSYAKYKEILRTKNTQAAKDELRKEFYHTILWEISPEGDVRSFGNPSSFDPQFTATIKDCLEGDRCNRLPVKQREACCSEKFTGPVISWKKDGREFTLSYSPDPSIQLKVAGEKSRRYCHAVQSLTF